MAYKLLWRSDVFCNVGYQFKIYILFKKHMYNGTEILYCVLKHFLTFHVVLLVNSLLLHEYYNKNIKCTVNYLSEYNVKNNTEN